MTKPFGKPLHHGRGLTKGLRLTISLWCAAFPAWLVCRPAAKRYPTLAEDPFFWPALFGFAVFYAVALALWLRRRPSPRAPGTSSRAGLFISRFLLCLLLSVPLGMASAILYEPALEVANGISSLGPRIVEHALVDRHGDHWVLDNPYWQAGFQWSVRDPSALPPGLTVGSLAKITLRTGLLGARWIESVEYTVLP
ncbi:MAG TPA: hypothetical protein VMU54_19780 [Planctomycetota bacterium]|nr:hypothetical protein [Planctomycetota bacterium]